MMLRFDVEFFGGMLLGIIIGAAACSFPA